MSRWFQSHVNDPYVKRAQVDGYQSDLTRSFYLGVEGSEQFWAVYNGVLAAQTAVFQAAAPGMPLQEVDALDRNNISAAGYGDFFGHGLGHGLGLEIHEAPFLSPRADVGAQLLPGMHVTIEPGIYITDWGGVRIEDLALVTENGLEPISRCPKTPLIPVSA